MKTIFKAISFSFLLVLAASFFIPRIYLKLKEIQNLNNSLSKDTEKSLISLTLEQKIGQLLIIGFEGKEITPELEELLKTVHPGGVLLLSRNIENENQLKKLIGDLQRISFKDNGLPIFVAIDQEGGSMFRIGWLKEKTSQSEIKNTEQAYEVGLRRGKEFKDLGVNLNLAPVLDVTEPGDFLYGRSFQKAPVETGELAKALISGQKTAGILTAIKHFPGYGKITFNPERAKLPILLETPEISQFLMALEAEPEMIMTANVIYIKIDENLPFSLSSRGTQFLKDKLKNNFLIISDDLSSPVLKSNFSLEKTIILAFEAGEDILIVAGFDDSKDPLYAFNFLLEAAKNGEISEERINQSVLKIIKLKEKLVE